MDSSQYIEADENCELIYDTIRSRLQVKLIPSHHENKLICRVSLGSEANVEGNTQYFPCLVTPEVREENRESLTLPLSILDIDGEVSIKSPEEAENDPSAESILRVEYEDVTQGNAVSPNMVDIRLLGLRANINMTRLANLYEKLMEYFYDRNDSQEFGTLLYRNNDPEYFHYIEQSDGIMHPHMKDYNGDQTNPLNGRVNGLFFCATLYNGGLPTISPYGPRRFQAKIQSLLENLGTWAIYFADFYCMEYTKGIHYVTLVLCKRGSEADQFCRRNLYRLPEQNPVFVINKTNNGFRICRREYAWVEIFYTEAINVREMLANKVAQMTSVNSGMYTMSEGGIPKNTSCPLCNVEPKQWNPVED